MSFGAYWQQFGVTVAQGVPRVMSIASSLSVGDQAGLPELEGGVANLVTSCFVLNVACAGINPCKSRHQRPPCSAVGCCRRDRVPPLKTAIWGRDADGNPTLSDQRISNITTRGRMAWQVSSGRFISAVPKSP